MEQWQIGDVTVTKILEDVLQDGELDGVLQDATPEKLLDIDWLYPSYITDSGKMKFSFHALVIETPTRRIIVDTCVGNDKNVPDAPFFHQKKGGRFIESLISAGFHPGTIDIVMCTHLHLDHIGWNTTLIDGRWVPTFPNARYLFAREEYQYWMQGNNTDVLAETQSVGLAESVQPVIDAGLVDVVGSDHRICDEVFFAPTPGHTPGHVAVRIESGGKRGLITGDAIHHPCQLVHPDWSSWTDFDQDASARTRRQIFDDMVGTDALIIGTHWATPSAANIVHDRTTYKLKNVGPQ